MKKHNLALVFCLLLSSTLGHEYLRAHEDRQHFHNRHKTLSRDHEKDGCQWVCPTSTESPSEEPITPSEEPVTPSEGPVTPSDGPSTPSEEPVTPSHSPGSSGEDTSETPDGSGSSEVTSTPKDSGEDVTTGTKAPGGNSTPPATVAPGGNSTTAPGGSLGLELTVIIIDKIKIEALVNITARVAIAFDYESQLVAVFNGNTGVVIVIDIHAQTGVYIKAGSKQGWSADRGCFESYLRANGGIKVLLKFGAKFSVKQTSDEIAKEVGTILINLDINYSLQIQAKVQTSITILVSISVELIGLLRGTLKPLLTNVDVNFKFKGGLSTYVSVNTGLAKILENITGGLSALLKAGVKLDLTIILGAGSGVDIFIALFAQISTKVDFSQYFKGIFDTLDHFLSILIYFAEDGEGSDGIFAIIIWIYRLNQNQSDANIQAFVKVLVKFIASSSSSGDIKVKLDIQIKALLQIITTQQTTFKNSAYFKSVFQFLLSIQQGNLTIGKINISAVIKILIDTSSSNLTRIIQIFIIVGVVVGVGILIITLFFVLLTLLGTVVGIAIVEAIVGRLDITIKADGNILAQIFGSIDIKALLSGGLNISFDALIQRIPVIGKIYAQINVALKANRQQSLSVIITSSSNGRAVGYLQGWIVCVLNIQGNLLERIFRGAIKVDCRAGFSISYAWQSSSSGSIGSGGGYGNGSDERTHKIPHDKLHHHLKHHNPHEKIHHEHEKHHHTY